MGPGAEEEMQDLKDILSLKIQDHTSLTPDLSKAKVDIPGAAMPGNKTSS